MNTNKNIFKSAFFVLLLCQFLWSCTDKRNTGLSPEQKKAKLDSLFLIQQQEIIAMEAELLRDRMSIEVKEKTDSILAARAKNYAQLPLPLPVVDSIIHNDTLVVTKDTVNPAP